MRVMVFPVAFMANTFAMMVVMIGLSLFGKSALAADFGLIHGATVALFYSFSGNARSLILSDSGTIDAPVILRLRLILLLPLGILAWVLCAGVVDSSWLFVLLLVVRRAAEWLAEIFLSEQELRHHEGAAIRFLLTQGCLSLALLLVLINDGPLSIPVTLLWALSPLLGCISLELPKRALNSGVPLISSIRLMLPHFGSTAVIGVSVYVFRLFILLVADKQVAGDLFSAFALGGILGQVFSQALGPTMVRHERRGAGAGRLVRLFNLVLVVMLLAGAVLAVSVWSLPHLLDWTEKDQLFWLAVGCSLMGGVVMVLAQRIRLRILQDDAGGDVFGSDMLANILLIASIPFLFYGIGVNALALLYLLGALLSWVFYASERHGLLSMRDSGWFTQKNLLLFIAVMLFLPIFFQLQGGIFDDPSKSFSSGGILALLPIPLSVLACYSGMVLLGRYSHARLALLSLFFVFIGMLLTSLLLGLDPAGGGKQKLILLIQYILPMFALVLGQQFGGREDALLLLAKGALFILLTVLPVQLLVTLSSADVLLSPSVYFFSIYQHLQYASLLFVAAFVLALFTLWGHKGFEGWLRGLTLLMGGYVVLSWSLLAMLLFVLAVCCFVAQQMAQGRRFVTLLGLPALAMSGALLAVFYISRVSQPEVLAPLSEAAKLSMQVLEGRVDYLERWMFYIDGICASWSNALFGHATSPARGLFPSALNYYLDFAYNFGLLGLLPLIVLALYSLAVVCRRWRDFWAHSPYLGLALVVIFMLVLDSSFKVGLRQPYSGVIMFFLWGLLLAVISLPDTRSSSANKKVF
ncbi:hypothetical protein ACF6ZU_08350 [Pseudomonas migulae]|uniref:hypothetical protein n=1 Tax=Pseudomonas migulae TaxID=78543 RepID=UPI003721785F